ncbi:spore germination protein [Neobacillus niacini]|uniref:spore germination protein n=1 Tax=Neobacillus niacini TaxID=86668 RepID=UPI0039837568
MPVIKNWSSKKRPNKIPIPESQLIESLKYEETNSDLSTVQRIKDIFEEDHDFSIRELEVCENIEASIVYLNSLIDKNSISEEVIKPLTDFNCDGMEKHVNSEGFTRFILTKVLTHADVKTETRLDKIIQALLHGCTLLIMEKVESVVIINTFQLEKRAIAQPETEQVIRGPRDGFIENLSSNTALIRSRLPVPEFRVKAMQIGTLTKSSVAYCYIEGIVNQALVEDVKKRLDSIDVDRILDAGYIEQFIQDNPRSPFPQIKSTERPDVVVGNLVEGRVAILVDGSPFVLIVPATFTQFYQTSEDYNERFIMASMIRMIRLIALLFSLIMPSLYVAVLSYHPELIPTAFAVAITSGRAGVPFPALVEVILMELAMEILREATVRMPKQVGGALSIVGVLVIGQAAVSAGFVSPITVVVLALTTVGSFATPAYNMAIGFRMMRFPLLFMTGIFGFYGLILGLLFLNNHVLSLKSFGVPYLSPIAPINLNGLKDTAIRAPLNWLLDRPDHLFSPNKRRIRPDDSETTNPLAMENMERGDQP